MKNNYGFTLIELVIVLSILAIIASAAVSAFVDIANRAFGVQEDATMRAVQSACLLYYARNGRWWGVNETEPPFRLLENPPRFVVEPPNGIDPPIPGIGNVDWFLYFDPSGIGDEIWQIWCPHSFNMARGKIWDFFSHHAEYNRTMNKKH
ncbi:MAG: prepilin-type N-terminal cleavage/methylation domain-containing protein [Candidatus Omnitrophota bacterium]